MANFGDKVLDVIQKGFHRKSGGDMKSLFWVDQWASEIPLKEWFPRLFYLNSKHNYIVDMGIWEDGVWNWRFEWRRQLFS